MAHKVGPMFILLGCHGPSLKCRSIHDIDGDTSRKCSPAKIAHTSSKLLSVPPVKATVKDYDLLFYCCVRVVM